MSGVFKKLNLGAHQQVVVVNAPTSFEPELASLNAVRILRDLQKISAVDFVLTFVTKKSEIDSITPKIVQRAHGDAIVWFAYPKGTSKKFKCDFNRDTGWDAMNERGFETVRAVAIDEDWSALRFRRSEFVKSRA